MTNKEAIEELKNSLTYANHPRLAAIEANRMSIHALEQIEELKRLCEKELTTVDTDVGGGDNSSNDPYWRGYADALLWLIDTLNGDPSELKKLAGEER